MDATEKEGVERRLRVVEALVRGQERHMDVAAVVYESVEVDEAASRVGELLQVDQEQAHAILEMQVWRLTKSQRDRLATDRDELRTLLES